MAVDILPQINNTHAAGFGCGVDPDRFEELVNALKSVLGPSSGLTSDDVDVAHLARLMERYDANDKGWEKYAMGDASRGYTRNLVDEGNGKSNLVGPTSTSRRPLGQTAFSNLNTTQLVLVWSPGKGSPIHDHGNAHCLMKILRGDLTETRYSFPNARVEAGPMEIISEKTYKKGAVAYMADELGVHRIWNKGSDFAVSLHRMCPQYFAQRKANRMLTGAKCIHLPM